MFMLNNSQSKCFHSEGCCAHPCACTEPNIPHPCVSQFNLVVDFFTVSHIFLFLCAPGKFGMGCLGFYFLWVQSICILQHVPELFVTHSVTWTRGEVIGLTLGQRFLRAPPVVPCELRSLWLLEDSP